jgi:adenylosuccinate lyase
MELNSLTAISPIDGRYRVKTDVLSKYFSEFALIKYRLRVEIEYLISLGDNNLEGFPSFTDKQRDNLREIYKNFKLSDAEKIKDIEKLTNHDVKAVEYFIKECLDSIDLSDIKEFVHFGLTSQDINNTANPLSLMEASNDVIIPEFEKLVEAVFNKLEEWNDISMLAKTHGQPASPTKLGKEFMVFKVRLDRQLEALRASVFYGKFGGATGNFNAHLVAYPEIDWVLFSNNFLKESLGLKRLKYTTQIDHYDTLAEYMDNLKRINTICLDLCKDIWMYISMNYFSQKVVKGEVGSSTMPHKVNPIDFENAEGNLGIANSILEHLSSKLPISRLQRDLTDSTVLRNIGVPLGHILIALKSIQKGWSKLMVNREVINKDLDDNWAVVGEAIQTILRREAYPNPYEKLKELTRNNEKITKDNILVFIESLDISERVKEELRAISPFNYTGIY